MIIHYDSVMSDKVMFLRDGRVRMVSRCGDRGEGVNWRVTIDTSHCGFLWRLAWATVLSKGRFGVVVEIGDGFWKGGVK